MRRLNVAVAQAKEPLKGVKKLDAFSKVPESYQETSAAGGGVSILTFLLILILIYSEVKYYTETELKFDYEVDFNFNQKMKINVDMVIAMRCDFIGADVLDITNQDTQSFGKLNEENTKFELSTIERYQFDTKREVNRYLREEYHAIHELLWVSGYKHSEMGEPQKEVRPEEADACRIFGSLELNKVAGNFHVTAGKSVPVIPRGHAHLSFLLSDSDYNFTHRINHLSFGDPVAGTISPLDGEEMITTNTSAVVLRNVQLADQEDFENLSLHWNDWLDNRDNHCSDYHMFQYFIKIVPTEVRTYAANADTYQYSVTERNRSIDHSSGSHGVPGIFFKYDLTSLKIRVHEEHRSYWQFLVRICGIIGGIFAVSELFYPIGTKLEYMVTYDVRKQHDNTEVTRSNVNATDKQETGMLHSLIGFVIDFVCCRYFQTNKSSNAMVQQPRKTLSLTTTGPLLSTQISSESEYQTPPVSPPLLSSSLSSSGTSPSVTLIPENELLLQNGQR